MSEIKLPVTVRCVGDDPAEIYDADGAILAVAPLPSALAIAAALDAAPKRAFEDLTAEELQRWIEEDDESAFNEAADSNEPEEIALSDWGRLTAQKLYRRLQAFAAPLRAEARREALEEAAKMADRFAAQTRDDFEGAAAKDVGAGIRSLIGGAV